MDAFQVINLVVSFVLPLIVGLLSKQSWNPNLKAVLLLLVAAISTLLTTLITAQSFDDWKTLAGQTALNWLVAVATHFHLWRPLGASAKVAEIGVHDTVAKRAA